MKRREKTYLRLDAEHRPLFAPVHSVYMTEKDRPRKRLKPKDIENI